MNTSASLIALMFTLLIATVSHAESLRCGGQLAHIGETKAEILEKCGDPVMTDAYCEPIAVNQVQGVQNGNNNIQNNIAIGTCENVDIWTYKPGSGKFTTHLYFSRGRLQNIRYGDRVK